MLWSDTQKENALRGRCRLARPHNLLPKLSNLEHPPPPSSLVGQLLLRASPTERITRQLPSHPAWTGERTS